MNKERGRDVGPSGNGEHDENDDMKEDRNVHMMEREELSAVEIQ